MNPFVFVLACIGMVTVVTVLFALVACLVIDRLDVEPTTAPTAVPTAVLAGEVRPSVADEIAQWLATRDRFTDWEKRGWWE